MLGSKVCKAVVSLNAFEMIKGMQSRGVFERLWHDQTGMQSRGVFERI